MTSFHGRGFFPGGIQLDDPLTVLAALEAFVGPLIEVTFIATPLWEVARLCIASSLEIPIAFWSENRYGM